MWNYTVLFTKQLAEFEHASTFPPSFREEDAKRAAEIRDGAARWLFEYDKYPGGSRHKLVGVGGTNVNPVR